jgi:SH3-like domain-containing protein
MNRIGRQDLILMAVLTLGHATAAGAEPVRCDISAYFLNSDSETNLRSAPDARAPVVRTIPGDGEVIATITGFEDGWFRIGSLETAGGEVDETLFAGRAWVHRSQLHTDVAGGHQDLRASPDDKALVVTRLAGDQPGVTLLACSGDWVQLHADGIAGWLPRSGQCSNPLTTCP